jgi:hypothetical protein
VTLRTESQSAWLAEVERAVRSEDADEVAVRRIVFADSHDGIGAKVMSSGLNPGSVTKGRGRAGASGSSTTIVLSPSPEGPMPEAR